MKFKTKEKRAEHAHKLEARRQKRIRIAIGRDIDLVSFYNNRSGEKLELEDYEANHVFKERERSRFYKNRERGEMMKSSKFSRVNYRSEKDTFEISVERNEGSIPSLPEIRVGLHNSGLKNDILIHSQEQLTELMMFLSEFSEEWNTEEAKKKLG